MTPAEEFRIVVLASGNGTNLQALLDREHGRDGTAIVGVGSDRPGAPALQRALDLGIETRLFPADAYPDRESRDTEMAAWIESLRADLVVLAGYMQVLSPVFTTRFRDRILNVHPSLLPSFSGLDAIGQALEHGVRVTGVTIHFVDEDVDTGPILLQQAVEVPADRSAGKLEADIHTVEHRLLPAAVRLVRQGRTAIVGTGRRRVEITGPLPGADNHPTPSGQD